MRDSALTYRQLDLWTRKGFLRPANGPTPGSGHPRQWSDHELQIAEIISRLRLAGIELDTAVGIARRANFVDPYEVTLAPGVHLRLDPVPAPVKPTRGDPEPDA